jgi:predicted S18 family serine protease
MTKNSQNKLFDINRFPLQEGILVFGISMSKIATSQSATKCFEYINFIVNKIQKPQVGLNFIYSDYLYFNSNEKASVLKNRYLAQIQSHKNQFEKLLNKNKWYIQKAFSFSINYWHI